MVKLANLQLLSAAVGFAIVPTLAAPVYLRTPRVDLVQRGRSDVGISDGVGRGVSNVLEVRSHSTPLGPPRYTPSGGAPTYSATFNKKVLKAIDGGTKPESYSARKRQGKTIAFFNLSPNDNSKTRNLSGSDAGVGNEWEVTTHEEAKVAWDSEKEQEERKRRKLNTATSTTGARAAKRTTGAKVPQAPEQQPVSATSGVDSSSEYVGGEGPVRRDPPPTGLRIMDINNLLT